MGRAPDYVGIEELAAFARVGDSVDDAVLALAVGTASRAIDRAADRQFGRLDVAEARYYTAQWDPRLLRWRVPIDDLMTTVDLAVAVATTDDLDDFADNVITGYNLRPVNAPATGRPYTELWVRSTSTVQPSCRTDAVRVTARWGWSGVPDAIRQATLLQASRLLSRRDAPFGISGSPETGGELRLLARLDPDVAVAVRPYRRIWGAV